MYRGPMVAVSIAMLFKKVLNATHIDSLDGLNEGRSSVEQHSQYQVACQSLTGI